jgi:Flp pilus assembly protein TadD/O-antigen ligase
VSRRLLIHSVLLIQFVCPLVFFTDLTRNPYITQISLLLSFTGLAGALWAADAAAKGRLALPRTPLDLPLAASLAVGSASWLWGYFGHVPFFRPAAASEGLRVLQFTLVNCLLAYYLGAALAEELPDEGPAPGPWAAFCLLWGAAWLLFPVLGGRATQSVEIWPHVWDAYGAFLWICGFAALAWISREGTVHHVWLAALSAGFLAAAYGVIQYFNGEFIWPKALDPYGGRSVSTFGNPNFMSSYLVVLFPVAAAYYLKARTRAQRALFAALLLAFEAALLSSLTRSSWIGAAAALGLFALHPEFRRLARKDLEFTGLVVIAGAVMALFWPQSHVGGYSSSVIGRLSETAQIFKGPSASYSPWHQRLLIWACAWQMGAENPLLGKGWGLFELFYPFYQGNILDHIDFFRSMRTHANNSHNEILEAWAQTGIAGVGVLLWTWTAFFRSVFDEARERPTRVWLFASAAGVAGMLIDNLLNVSLHFAVPAMMFWWQAGTVMGRVSRERGRLREPPWKGPRAAAALLAACWLAAGLNAWQCVRLWAREANYFMGFKLARNGRMSAALESLEKAYRWHPREVNTDYELGNAYARTERFDKAVWAYAEALNSNSGYDEIYFNLATLLAMRLGRPDEAGKYYLMSWAINPLSQELYSNYAGLLLRDPARNRALAIGLLERAAHFFPDNPQFANNLGYLYSLGREHSKAEKVYADLLERRPEFELAERNLRASLRQSGGRTPGVLLRLDDLRRLEALLRRGDYGPGALELSRRVASAFPDDSRAAFYRGNLELLHGDPALAERLLRRVVENEGRNAAAWTNLAQALQRLGRLQEAVSALESALRADPGNAAAAAQLRALRGR